MNNWKQDTMNQNPYFNKWRHKTLELFVLRSFSTFKDGSKAVHVSVSCTNRLPNWEEMKMIKRDFIGDDKIAYQVFPKQADYVNLHPYCLHLWSPENVESVCNLKNLVDEKAY